MGSILWIFKNWQMLLLVAGLICALVLGVYLKGRADGIAHVESKNMVETIRQSNKNIRIQNEQDSVVRPDDNALYNSLLNGNF